MFTPLNAGARALGALALSLVAGIVAFPNSPVAATANLQHPAWAPGSQPSRAANSSGGPIAGVAGRFIQVEMKLTAGTGGVSPRERQGGGDGRVYTITVVCEDAEGNDSAPMTTTVAVPHSGGK